MKQGAYDYLTKPFHLPELEVHIQKAYEKVQLARRERQWVQQLHYESPRYRLVGSSPAMRQDRGPDREGGADRRHGAGPRRRAAPARSWSPAPSTPTARGATGRW